MDATQNTTSTSIDSVNALSINDSAQSSSNRRPRPRRPQNANQDDGSSRGAGEASRPRQSQRPRNPNPRPPREVNSQDGVSRAPISASTNDNGEGASTWRNNQTRNQGPRPGGGTLPPRPQYSTDGVEGALDQRPPSQAKNRRRKPPTGTSSEATSGQTNPPANRHEGGSSRRAKFGASLSKPTDDVEGNPSASKQDRRPPKAKREVPEGDDLTSTLIRGLSSPPYADCPICFSAIRPDHAIWSCSPLIPIIVASTSGDGSSQSVQVQAQYCWTSFHIKCIRSWAEKSVKEVADAWRARGEDRKGDWRCPGCQGKREVVPNGYWCFCGTYPEPKSLRLSTPHSCGNSCSRVRESGCGHPCPLKCHPGPCPPCQVITQLDCYCPRKKVLTFRCGIDSRDWIRGKGVNKSRDLSCHEVCSRLLNCGVHKCAKICHQGDCGTCEEKEIGRCFCGKEEKEVICGQGEKAPCFVEGSEPWVGRFNCDNVCDRFFDCGVHKCQKPCHIPSPVPPVCPRSPSVIAHCPCGRNAIASSTSSTTDKFTFPARTSCSDPIPLCSSPCEKPHSACGHPCKATCHEGPCPPCLEDIVRPCRCGATTKRLLCYKVFQQDENGDQEDDEAEILCDKPCTALRACGRHQCRRLCCPLASLASLNQGGKNRRKRPPAAPSGEGQIGEEQGGWHECDLVCAKMLGCGQHRCEMRDHKGPCAPCLRSSFEEMVCSCGRTVYEPPIPCGTVMQCHYPCPRPSPPCGHPSTPHSCHEYDVACPPCVWLASKLCACGKNQVPNVRCSLEREKVSCGTVCGKLMSCGFHHCERLCHMDDCGKCTAPCGKSRKSCLPEHHPCSLPCHAPASCPEANPCTTPIVLSCPCGRIKQSVSCGRTSASKPPASGYVHPATPKCSTECQIAKRNARLAEALGINPDNHKSLGGPAVYSDELTTFANGNVKFLNLVEKTFGEFVAGERRTQILPHMPPEKRKFVHDLATIYRMDTQMIDQEPHRSVQLIRRVDTRVPTPVLSASLPSSGAGNSLGKLVDSRALRHSAASVTPSGSGSSVPQVSSPWRSATASASAPTPSIPHSSRGWAPVPVASKSATTAAAQGEGFGDLPPPTTSRTGSRTGSPAPQATGLLRSNLGLGGQGRPSTPLAQPSQNQAEVVALDVPDNWEDDV